MTLIQLVAAIIARGFASCEPTEITFEQSGCKYAIPANGHRYALKVTDHAGNSVPFAWVDVSVKGSISGMESPTYYSSAAFAAVHGDIYKRDPKAFRALCAQGKNETSPFVMVASQPVVGTPEALASV